MFDQVQVQALAGPHKDIQRLVPKPLPGCVLRAIAIVLLEGEPSPQSEVLSILEQVFIKDLSPQHDAANTILHCSIILFLDPD